MQPMVLTAFPIDLKVQHHRKARKSRRILATSEGNTSHHPSLARPRFLEEHLSQLARAASHDPGPQKASGDPVRSMLLQSFDLQQSELPCPPEWMPRHGGMPKKRTVNKERKNEAATAPTDLTGRGRMQAWPPRADSLSEATSP